MKSSTTVDDDNHIHLTRFYPAVTMDKVLCEVQSWQATKISKVISYAQPVLRKTKLQNHIISQTMKEKWRRLSKNEPRGQ